METKSAEEQQLIRYKTIFDKAPIGIMYYDSEGKITECNDSFVQIIGSSKDVLIGLNMFTSLKDDELLHAIRQSLKGQDIFYQNRYRSVTADKQSHIKAHFKGLKDEHDRVTGIGLIEDITETTKLYNKAKENELRYRALFHANKAVMLLIDPDNGTILACNKAAQKFYGYSEEELTQKKIQQINVLHPSEINQEMQAAREEKREHFFFKHRLKDGTIKDVEVVSGPFEQQGKTLLYSIIHDVSDKKKIEQKLKHLYLHDSLTDLPNRNFLHEILQRSIKHVDDGETKLAVCFFDLDNFKNINDVYGHEVGDQIIHKAAWRLEKHASLHNTLARVGGDEFVLVLEGMDDLDLITMKIREILKDFEKPLHIEDTEHFISTSVGVSVYPDDSKDAKELIKYADMAMYRAKESGKNTFSFYQEEMTEKLFEKMLIESNLRKAIDNEEFTVHYQPQIDLKSGTITGLEALVRWQHSEMGLVSPAKFIPSAEDTKLIIPLGEYVLRRSCELLKRWHDRGLYGGVVAVNVSGIQLEYSDFVKTVREVLETTGLHPRQLELEVTESTLMWNKELWIQKLTALKELGITLSIDDFGTGYSSLSYLHKLPIDKLKIDRSFVFNLPADRDARVLTDSIIALCDSMGLRTIAEGIETKEQARYLVEKKCEDAQGFYFSKPLPPEEVEGLLAKRFSF